MDTLSFSLNAVLPILLTMLLGMLFRSLGWFPEKTAVSINKLCFSVLMPLNIFKELYATDIKGAMDWHYIGFGVAFILVTLLVLCLVVPRFVKDNIERGECIQGIFRGSVSLISISLLTNLYGESGVSVMSFLLPITLVMYNAISVVILSLCFHSDRHLSIGQLAKEAITNPFVIASILGMLFATLNIRLPVAVHSVIKSVGATGTPMALLAMGALIDPRQLTKDSRTALIASVVRQFVFPVIILTIAVLLGFRGAQLGSFLCIVCTPTATVGYTLSINMGGNGKLASKIVVYTTILSFFSMFLSIAVLHHLNML